jgi:O-antigen ligase
VEHSLSQLLNKSRLPEWFFHSSPWIRALSLFALCLIAAVPLGAVLGMLGSLYGAALIVSLAIFYVMLRSIQFGLVALIGVIFLLPFAALPVNIGFSPTFLDLVLMTVFFVWVSRVASHQQPDLLAPMPSLGVLAFVALAVVSFILGLQHAPLTANTARHFAELMLGVLLFFVVVNAVRTQSQLRWLVLGVISAATVASLVGIALYVMPQPLAIRLLSVLRVVRYPSGAGVLRFILDDPTMPMRATSTSVDPNVLGGVLVFSTTLAVAQVMARKPIFDRRWLALAAGAMGLCLILTFSRGSFVGLLAALAMLGMLRYRKLLWIGLLALALLLLLPPTQAYVQHFIQGLRGQDLATQMRFGEYKDALILISRYPWLGVGFAGTPEIDTYLGVSSVYLLIAEEMGFVGLTAYLATLIAFLVSGLRVARRISADSSLEPLVYGPCLAVLGAMVAGVLDHYLFNLVFPHATALMWLVIGLGVVGTRLAQREDVV